MNTPGWWRRNLPWLAALPLLATGAAAANAERVVKYWWPDAPRHEIARTDAGAWVEVTQEYSDIIGSTSRTFQVRLSAVEPIEEIDTAFGPEPIETPEGVVALAVRLDFEAEPDQQLSGCRLELVDAEGNRYQPDPERPAQPTALCVPPDRQGPQFPLFAGSQRDYEPDGSRPRSWSVSPVILVPAEVEPATVRIYYDLPEFVTLETPD